MLPTSLAALGFILVLMLTLWVVSLARRDVSIVDPFWGFGFVAVASFAAAVPPGLSELAPRGRLALAMVAVWGLRLSLFLLWRNRGHGEDFRYRAMREHHGDRFPLVSLGTVFLLQGVVLWTVSWPLQSSLRATTPWSWLDACGAAIWLIGVLFESIGDWQLARFKTDPANRGRVLDRGLWRYTRHPNYFGDFCVWWGFYLVAAAGGAWWTVFSPLLMSFLLLRVSGVTLLESTIVERRPEYRDYIRRTSPFFPRPPRS